MNLSLTAARRKTIRFYVAIILVNLSLPSALGADLFIATDGVDEGPCTSLACASLQYALTQSKLGDKVCLYPGIYSGVGNRRISLSGDLGGLTVQATTSIQNFQRISTIGATNFAQVDLENDGALFLLTNVSNFHLKDLIVSRGSGHSEIGDNTKGGALRITNNGENLTITDVEFRECSMEEGGSVAVANASPTFIRVKFFRNEGFRGGAVHISGSHGFSPVSFVQCVFVEGYCMARGRAGGVYMKGDAVVDFQSCIFEANVCSAGGAIYQVDESVAMYHNTTFLRNRATLWSGGAFFLLDTSSAEFDECIFQDNDCANREGGAVNVALSSSCIFNNCNLVGNTAPTSSGGHIMVKERGSVTMYNSTLSFGSAFQGGAVLVESSGTLRLSNVTFSNISAANKGGALHVLNEGEVEANHVRFHLCSASMGGAVNIEDHATISLTGCEFVGNSASSSGGGVSVGDQAEIQAEECLFQENVAQWRGGGVFCQHTSAAGASSSSTSGTNATFAGWDETKWVIRTSVFEGNQAEQGGGLFQDSVMLRTFNSTFRRNKASGGFELDPQQELIRELQQTCGLQDRYDGGAIYWTSPPGLAKASAFGECPMESLPYVPYASLSFEANLADGCGTDIQTSFTGGGLRCDARRICEDCVSARSSGPEISSGPTDFEVVNLRRGLTDVRVVYGGEALLDVEMVDVLGNVIACPHEPVVFTTHALKFDINEELMDWGHTQTHQFVYTGSTQLTSAPFTSQDHLHIATLPSTRVVIVNVSVFHPEPLEEGENPEESVFLSVYVQAAIAICFTLFLIMTIAWILLAQKWGFLRSSYIINFQDLKYLQSVNSALEDAQGAYKAKLKGNLVTLHDVQLRTTENKEPNSFLEEVLLDVQVSDVSKVDTYIQRFNMEPPTEVVEEEEDELERSYYSARSLKTARSRYSKTTRSRTSGVSRSSLGSVTSHVTSNSYTGDIIRSSAISPSSTIEQPSKVEAAGASESGNEFNLSNTDFSTVPNVPEPFLSPIMSENFKSRSFHTMSVPIAGLPIDMTDESENHMTVSHLVPSILPNSPLPEFTEAQEEDEAAEDSDQFQVDQFEGAIRHSLSLEDWPERLEQNEPNLITNGIPDAFQSMTTVSFRDKKRCVSDDQIYQNWHDRRKSSELNGARVRERRAASWVLQSEVEAAVAAAETMLDQNDDDDDEFNLDGNLLNSENTFMSISRRHLMMPHARSGSKVNFFTSNTMTHSMSSKKLLIKPAKSKEWKKGLSTRYTGRVRANAPSNYLKRATLGASGSLRLLDGKQTHSQFLQELKELVNMRHPNVVYTWGATRQQDIKQASMARRLPRHLPNYWLVQEYFEHGSLHNLLSNRTLEISAHLLQSLLQNIVDGMVYLHDHKVVHGNLRSSTVMVGAHFVAKVAEFGISKLHSRRFGMPFWTAPEILAGRPPNFQSDVYAFGIILWELFTRKLPYWDLLEEQLAARQGKDVRLGALEILRQVVDPQLALRPTCPANMPLPLRDLFQECVNKNRRRRPTFPEIQARIQRLDRQLLAESTATAQSQDRELLLKMLPPRVAMQLRQGQMVEPEEFDSVTILFSDIVGFTDICAELTPQQVMDMLHRLYKLFDKLTKTHNLFKVETIGDAYMVVGGLPDPQPDHVVRIARMALDMCVACQTVPISTQDPGLGDVCIRVGFHTGPVVASVVGDMNPRYCLFGDAVNTASRMESSSESLKIHLSSVSYKLLTKQASKTMETFECSCRGPVSIKGKGVMTTYFLENCINLRTNSSTFLSRQECARFESDQSNPNSANSNPSSPNSPSNLQNESRSQPLRNDDHNIMSPLEGM